MAKKSPKVSSVEPVTEPDVIAPPADVAPDPLPAFDPVPAVEPAPIETKPLEPGEIILPDDQERLHGFSIGGIAYHHVRETKDGRWIYAEVRPRG